MTKMTLTTTDVVAVDNDLHRRYPQAVLIESEGNKHRAFLPTKYAKGKGVKSFLVGENHGVEVEVSDYYLNTKAIDAILKVLKEEGIRPQDVVISITSVWLLANPYMPTSYYIVYTKEADTSVMMDGLKICLVPKPINFEKRVDYEKDYQGLGILKDSGLDYIRAFDFYEKEQAAKRQKDNYARIHGGN